MPRSRAPVADADDSDASFLPEEDMSDVDEELSSRDDDSLFDVDGDGGSVTDATDTEEPFEYDADDFDVDDQIQLFGGNVHPPEYYRQAVAELNTSEFDSDDYRPGTTRLLDSVDEQWRLFCDVLNCDALRRDPQEWYESLQGDANNAIRLLYNFFDWSLNQKVGKDGRKKPGIKKRSSLGTLWKVFRLAFERTVGDKIDPKLNRMMHKVLRKLAKLHGLSDQKRENRCMTINDLKEQVETTLSTTKKSFKLGELRILAVLFLLLLAAPGARPTSILRIRFGDVRVVLERDPEGGPHNILVKYALAFTKSFLGEKATHTITIPETMFDPCLFLSPHVFLLAILFRHRAFRARNLTSPHQLDNLDINPGERELLLPLREDLNEVPIFRQAVQTLTGYEISPDRPITYAMMAAWVRKIGEILGFQYPTIPYSLRYNAANEFDQSTWMSEALRNLTLDHVDSGPFRKHYLGREVAADVWGIQRNQKPQQALIKQSNSLGHSMSKRRPIDLTPEQAASITTHPLIRRLTKELQAFRQGSQEYREARQVLRNAKHRLRRNLKQKIRDEWTANQAVEDIERQLQGLGFAKPAAADKSCRPQRPAQKRLMEALTAPLVNTLEAQYRRRDNAIDAVVAYCVVEEGCAAPQRCAVSTGPTDRSPNPDPPAESLVHAAMMSVFVRDQKERPRRCFLCVGKALTLSPDDHHIGDLIREFYTSGDLSKHFRRKHLSKLQGDDSSHCQVCDMTLDHKMHLQNHALRIHGTVS